MKVKIIAISMLAFATITMTSSCQKEEDKSSKVEQTEFRTVSGDGPSINIGIRITIPRLKWDRPARGCRSGFGLCNPENHPPVTSATNADMEISMTSPNQMKIKFLKTFDEMGETVVPEYFYIDNESDLVLTTEIIENFGATEITLEVGEYPVLLDSDGTYYTLVGIISDL